MNLTRVVAAAVSLLGMIALGTSEVWISRVPSLERGPGAALIAAPLAATICLESSWRSARAAQGAAPTGRVATAGRVVGLLGAVVLLQAVLFAFGEFLASELGCGHSHGDFCGLGSFLASLYLLVGGFALAGVGLLLVLLARALHTRTRVTQVVPGAGTT